MIRFFLFSILWVAMQSCSSYKPDVLFKEKKSTMQNLFFADQAQEYVYTALINAFGKEITGILVIKPLDNDSHRLVLTTDFGNTLLDLTINKEGYIKNYAIPDLDKKIILNVISSDFKLLVKRDWEINAVSVSGNMYMSQIGRKKFYLSYNDKDLYQLVYAKQKKKVAFTYNNIEVDKAKEIQIQHFNFNLKIELKEAEM